MKKTIGILGGIVLSLLSLTMNAQTPDTTKPQTPDTTKVQALETTTPVQPTTNEPIANPTTTTTPETTTTSTDPTSTDPWDPQKNPTVAALTAPYKDKMLPPRPALTPVDIFPVLGKYTSNTTVSSTDSTTTMSSPEAGNVTISLDQENKGLVWVEGLPMGKIKAMLRKSPATYKIPAQKTEDGKDVAEGTLVFDRTSGTLNIVIGKPYNSEDPASAFVTAAPEEPVAEAPVAKTKTKSKTKVKAPEPPKPYTYTGTRLMPLQ